MIPTPKYRNQRKSMESSDKEISENTFEKISKERQPEKIPYDIEKEHRLRANRAEINKVRKENVDVFLHDWLIITLFWMKKIYFRFVKVGIRNMGFFWKLTESAP